MAEYRIRKVTWARDGVWYVIDRKIWGIWLNLSQWCASEGSIWCFRKYEDAERWVLRGPNTKVSKVVWP